MDKESNGGGRHSVAMSDVSGGTVARSRYWVVGGAEALTAVTEVMEAAMAVDPAMEVPNISEILSSQLLKLS